MTKTGIMRWLLLCGLLWTTALLTAQEDDFYTLENIQEVRITFAEDKWANMLDSLKEVGDDDRLIGTVEVNGETYEQAGIRYKGNSSYNSVSNDGLAKLPFNIKLDEVIDDQGVPGGYETLKLSNGFRDPSFLREVLAYEIAGKYMPSPKANFAKLYVNDEYLGLYTSVESIDKHFLREYYGEDEGTFVKCDPKWNAEIPTGCPKGDKASLMYLGKDTACYMGLYEMKSDDGWEELVELAETLNSKPGEVEDALDVDYALWMLAFDNVLVNLDSYIGRLCHNYYLYRSQSGQFHPMIWDMNLAFGGFQFTGLGEALSIEEMQEMSLFLHYKEQNDKRPLVTELLSDNLYRKIYVAHAKTILEENFVNGQFEKRARAIQEIIAPEVENDTNRLYTYEAFRQNLDTLTKAGSSEIVGLLQLMNKRAEYLSTHPLLTKPAPKITDVQHNKQENRYRITAAVEDPEAVWVMYRYGQLDRFKKVQLKDDGTLGDKTADDGIWSTLLGEQDNLQYYIVAEGKVNASLSPKRASFEFYDVSAETPMAEK